MRQPPALIPAALTTALTTMIPVVLVIGALTYFDVPKSLGAHPWWSQKVLLIGAPFGVVLSGLVGLVARSAQSRLVFFFFATLAAFTVAHYGKTQFAASYAEDAFAGKLWYLGWVVTGAALTGWLLAVAQKIATPRS